MSAPTKRLLPSQAQVLEQLAREADLLAAHHGEYVRTGEPASQDVQKALRAAVSFGCAIGLRRATELIRESAL